MSGLPQSVTAEQVVKLSGGDVKIRPLTVRETRHVQAIKDEEKADVVCIANATGLDEADVTAWISTASPGDLNALIRAIFTASGIGQAAQFPKPPSDDAGVEQPAQ